MTLSPRLSWEREVCSRSAMIWDVFPFENLPPARPCVLVHYLAINISHSRIIYFSIYESRCSLFIGIGRLKSFDPMMLWIPRGTFPGVGCEAPSRARQQSGQRGSPPNIGPT